MEGETSWVSHCLEDTPRDLREFDSVSELIDEGNNEVLAVSLDLILPDDLLERILAYLPIASIFRAGCVCKRWHEIVGSTRFLWNFSHVLSQKPWYFMFTSSDEPIGYAYEPILRKWYGIELPLIETSNWFIASSCGLICFMDNDSRSELYVCNPITKCYKRLQEPPGLKFSDYSALAISVNRMSHNYNVSVVKSKQVPGNFFQWDLSIHIYDAQTMMWVTPLTEVLTGWRGGDESMICDGVLYFLIYSTGGGTPENRHGLIAYNLSNQSSHGLLTRSSITVPWSLTCGRLMNLKEKLVMVGGIGKQDRPDIIKGIGIWILNGKEWQEISRMPHKFFQGFGEFDDVFASSGTDDLVYIQSYGAPALLVFDMNQKQWKWSQKCPVTKRHFAGQYMALPKKELLPLDFKATRSTWIQYSKKNPKSLTPGTVTDFQWKDYCPAVFRHLQELANIDYADYMLSVCEHETLREISSPGKSGSLLFKSKDDRFVIKTLKKSEVKVLCEMLPNYLSHVKTYRASLLIKLYGLHAVRPIGGLKVYFVVMANVLPSDILIHRCYDLKGSSQGRTLSKAGDHEKATFKDLDLEFLFYLNPLTRHRLLAQIKCDCKFLEAQGIMDYSLLLGIHVEAPSQGTNSTSPEGSLQGC